MIAFLSLPLSGGGTNPRLVSCAVRSIVVVAALVWLTHPASAQLACPAKAKSQSVVDLMFGRKIGERIGVSNAAWMRFVDREITPRFPEGLTVVDAAGQWRDTKTGGVVREPSKIVTIVLSDPEKQQAALDAVIDAYKKKFRQQAVGVIFRPACISFQ